MDAEEFRKYGRKMVDYIADYLENIRDREVVHKVTPGYLKKQLPDEAPENPEDFEEVFNDIEKFIMPGVRQLPLYPWDICNVWTKLLYVNYEESL